MVSFVVRRSSFVIRNVLHGSLVLACDSTLTGGQVMLALFSNKLPCLLSPVNIFITLYMI